jgi:hypothetical protein
LSKIATFSSCSYCEKEFTPKRNSTGKFCSRACCWAFRASQATQPEIVKRCNRCGVVKVAGDFYTIKSGRLHSECRECTRERNSVNGAERVSRLAARHIDLKALQFGRYTVIELCPESRNSGRVWLCECSCGTRKKLTTGTILYSARGHNKTKIPHSCGCGKAEALLGKQPGTTKALGESAFNMFCLGYKHSARARKLSFTITNEDIKFISSLDCFYCGSPPRNIFGPKRANGGYLQNGIDRVDNTKGYDLENCVPCCKQCNYAKRDQTTEEFYAWISRLTRFRKNGDADDSTDQ